MTHDTDTALQGRNDDGVSLTINPGDRVTVLLDRHDEPRDAKVVCVPPFDETVVGETRTVTDKVKVEYVGTARRGFGNMRENVPVETVTKA